MHILVMIDLTAADIARFEAYERQVLPLVLNYDGKLVSSVRSMDGHTETHLLHFPNAMCFDAFLADPARLALKEAWQLSGAVASVSTVELVDYH